MDFFHIGRCNNCCSKSGQQCLWVRHEPGTTHSRQCEEKNMDVFGQKFIAILYLFILAFNCRFSIHCSISTFFQPTHRSEILILAGKSALNCLDFGFNHKYKLLFEMLKSLTSVFSLMICNSFMNLFLMDLDWCSLGVPPEHLYSIKRPTAVRMSELRKQKNKRKSL